LRQRWQVRARILQQIQAAKRTIFIANAYLVPDGRMLRALAKAALRGIDVRIMVSKHSDIVFMPYITSGFYGHLLRAGIRVYQFNPAFLHMKIMMIDDWALVGSSNLNHRSWLHDLEVDAVITDPQRRLELQKLFANNLKLCSQVSWLQLRQRPWWARVIGTLGYYMRFWI
jgi:cardiolipin synthase